MPVTTRRLVTFLLGSSIGLALIGLAWDASRFGWGTGNALEHLQRELTRRVADRARAVQTTAVRVARNADLVEAAKNSRDRVPDLFEELGRPVAADPGAVTATIWVPSGPLSSFRALAWTEGPSENIPLASLNRDSGFSVVTGAGGLRLMYMQPIERNRERLGVAAAETPLSTPSATVPLVPGFVMPSSAGLVHISRSDGSTSLDPENGFTVSAPSGERLIDVTLFPDQIRDSRRTFRWRVLLVALLPWTVFAAVVISQFSDRRRRAASIAGWVAWTIVTCAIVAFIAAIFVWLAARAGLAAAWGDLVLALAALAIAAIGPGKAWQRSLPLRETRGRGARFLIEHFLGGLLVAGVLVATAWLWREQISPASIEQWHLSALPASLESAAALAALLVAQIALAWMAAAIIGVLAARWRVSWHRPATWGAVLLWLAPSVAVLAAPMRGLVWPVGAAATLIGCAAAFGLTANALRRHHRHTSEARRLAFQFAALMAPVLAVYPLAASSADRWTRDVIEQEYAPATQAAQQPDELLSSLTQASAGIDAIGELPDLLREAGTSVNSTKLAFHVWNRTSLSDTRVNSQIELYGPSKQLVSHFSLNVPEFGTLSRTTEPAWEGSGCEWTAFAEVARFGADDRRMLHAERGLCGAGGEFLGAVTLRIMPDYRTLPFVSSANPYYEAMGGRTQRATKSRVPDLQVVVYGWGLQPAFVSGRVIWPIDTELFDRLYASPAPFWVDRTVDDRMYHIRFLSDRGGIYAVGYPAPTPLQHATRLAESAALLLILFGAYLATTVALAPLLRRRLAPLGRLFAEIRASFYRKLFLFFVVAAIGPVVLFAVAFGAYMTGKLRADVESEAGSVVLMARRVLDEVGAAQAAVNQARLAPTDDEMAWIRQVVDQDVNLFEGPELLATSQRDLFDSGLLPTRTPAKVYRNVVLDRLPVFVGEDRLGAFGYLVAAAPVPSLGRETILTVPLASRQREIERQIDDLTQGVLTGAVVLVLFAAALGASVAARVSDPVARLTRATRLVAAGRFDERLAADTADELGRLVADFNRMTETLVAQRAELARANQLQAWAEMARQVAHEIKNPLTPIQLAAEHLQRVHNDASRPLGPIVDQCLTTVLQQVRLLRQIASEFSMFAGAPTPRFEDVNLTALLEGIVEPYRTAPPANISIVVSVAHSVPVIWSDRTLLSRALTNLVENAMQAMPTGGRLTIDTSDHDGMVNIRVIDTGVGMNAEGVQRAFEPYFSTKTGGSGLGLANARRNIELCGGSVALTSAPGAGTTVTVSLPVARRDEPAAAQ